MKLSVGIVGLPNVGKSTLFNALLKKQIANVANYPFCTIEPNIGVIEVPDKRLPVLARIVKTEKIVPAVVEFYDIAGLVKGASVGEGLGNKFLAHIREVALIVHVVRFFEDSSVVHVKETIEPKEDIETIEAELMLADLATLNKQTEPRMNATKEEIATFEIVKILKDNLNKGIPARKVVLDEKSKEAVKNLNLLTAKPVLYLFNLSEKQLENWQESEKRIKEILKSVLIDAPYLFLCAKLENEVLAFSETEQKEFLKQYHLEDIGLNRLIQKAYSMLDLFSFLTAGEKEVRAWTIRAGSTALMASSVIHTDFAKNFIKADVINYKDFVQLNGWVAAREKGKVETAGRDYIMQDGDIVEFKIGI